MHRNDNLTTFICQVPWNQGIQSSWIPKDLSRSVKDLLCLFLLLIITMDSTTISNMTTSTTTTTTTTTTTFLMFAIPKFLTHTHTHTHIYIYIYIQWCVSFVVFDWHIIVYLTTTTTTTTTTVIIQYLSFFLHNSIGFYWFRRISLVSLLVRSTNYASWN